MICGCRPGTTRYHRPQAHSALRQRAAMPHQHQRRERIHLLAESPATGDLQPDAHDAGAAPLVVSCPTVAAFGNRRDKPLAVRFLSPVKPLCYDAYSCRERRHPVATPSRWRRFRPQVKIPSNGCATSGRPRRTGIPVLHGRNGKHQHHYRHWVPLGDLQHSELEWQRCHQLCASGTGNGTVTYQVQPNAGADQSGTLSGYQRPCGRAGGAIAGLNLVGSMPGILQGKKTGPPLVDDGQ